MLYYVYYLHIFAIMNNKIKNVVLFAFLAMAVSLVGCKDDTGSVPPAKKKEASGLEVTRQAVPILFKITGETCYYCGDWGWAKWSDLADKYKDGKGLSWSNYGSGFSNSFFRNQEIQATMDPIENMFEEGGGKPNFATNGTDYSTSSSNAESAANDFIATNPSISAALEATIEGTTLTVKATAKVFEDMTGDYVMGAYLIEDKVMGKQSGPIGAGGKLVPHHLVMRGSLSDNAWGESIITGSASKDETFNKTYSVEIPSTYNQANFSYGIIIWKKDGSKYSFVNAYSTQ